MNCALWLNRKKILHASEISENLDIASLRGYFLAGSLIGWLEENGGKKYAAALRKVRADDKRLNEKLAKVFGGVPLPSKALDGTGADASSAGASVNLNNGGSFVPGSFGGFGSFGSFTGWEWLLKLFSSGSFGSFRFGSFHEWEWEWVYRLFFGGSFTGGSFQWERLFGYFGSLGGALGSFYFGSFGGLFGSFAPFAFDASKLAELDEYDRVMLETLAFCPLDRFGYGIHNI